MRKKRNYKVAILGKLPTKFEAPFDDESWDIWTYNYHVDGNRLPRITQWFDLHAKYPTPKATINRTNFPFLLCENLVGGSYFNNTAPYLIAYAILKHYKEIALYGMRFTTENEERTAQRQNTRELMFFAKGRGIKVSAPVDPIMTLCYPRYGV